MNSTQVPLFLTLLLLSASLGCCQILVPAYFDPAANPQAWTSLTSAAALLPNQVIAIANPSNGAGSAPQSSYASVFSALQAQKGRVLGYVFTSYGSKSSASVQEDVSNWYQFYPTIDGIFFDEVPNTDGFQAHYQSLYNFVKSKNSSALVVNNPGSPTLESYLFFNGARVADVICTYESGTGGVSFQQSSWAKSYPRTNFYGLFYNVSDVDVADFDYGDVIDHAFEENIGWIYVTDDNLPNPWDTIASYFSDEVSYIRGDETMNFVSEL